MLFNNGKKIIGLTSEIWSVWERTCMIAFRSEIVQIIFEQQKFIAYTLSNCEYKVKNIKHER